MPLMLRGRLLAVVAALVAVMVGVILLVPVHPESGLLHLLAAALPSGALAGGSPGWWAVEDLGNIALFLPVGAIAACVLRPTRAILIGVAISAACEAAQLLIPARHGSLQDVAMNTIGVAVGVVASVAVRRAAAQARATRPHSVQAQ